MGFGNVPLEMYNICPLIHMLIRKLEKNEDRWFPENKACKTPNQHLSDKDQIMTAQLEKMLGYYCVRSEINLVRI